MSISTIQHAQACYEEEVAATWHDWRGYLQANLQILDARAARPQAALDHDEDGAQGAGQAEQNLALIPSARRALFDAVRQQHLEQRRAVLEASLATPGAGHPRLADPDDLERLALNELLAGAEGRGEHAEPGWGTVPLGAARDWKWFQVDIGDLTGMPDEAAYRASARSDGRVRQLRAAAGVVAVLVLLGILWWTLPSDESASAGGRRGTITANGKALAPRPIRTVTLVQANGTRATLPVTATDAAAWPESSGPLWRPAAIPPQLCLPPDRLAGLSEVRIGGNGEPEHAYTLKEVRSSATDLVLDACGAGAGPARYGTLTTVETPILHQVGEPVDLDGVSVTLETVAVRGPAEDPELPAGSLRVLLRVRGTVIEWNAYAPALVLSDGRSIQSPQIALHEGGAELRYLVTTPAPAPEAIWSLTLPPAGETRRWRLSLPPARDRTAVLRDALRVEEVTAERALDGIRLGITVHNRGPAPLMLSPDDLALAQGDLLLTTLPGAGLGLPLASGERRTLEFELAPAPQGPFTISLGAARFEIRP
jgi:hypothetical protein